MKHWDSEFWTQHLQDCFFLQDEGFETADEAAELGWAKEDFHAWWYCSNPIVDLLPSTRRSSWTKRCGKAEKCIKMRYGASEIVRFWMQKILKLYFLSAAITTDLVGVVMVFTCSLQQLATSPDLLCLARMSCHEWWHFSNPNSDMLPSIINPSFQLNRTKWKTGTPLKCSQMQHGASKTLRFWVQTIFKFCFLFAGGSWEYPGQCGSCCSPGQGCGFEQG